MQEFTAEELAAYNGQDGKPVYVAVGGKVYDVSESGMWRTGSHMKRHHAGADLTTDIKAAPHEADVLERFPAVGLVKREQSTEPPMPAFLAFLLRTFPMLRRHPHPMMVHFPIAFMVATTGFSWLAVLFGVNSFATTALHCLAAGILFTIVAAATGFYAWWLTYLSRPLKAVRIKIVTTIILFVLQLFIFGWRVQAGESPAAFTGAGLFYLFLVTVLSGLVAVNGWFGASLTFPVEE